MTVRAPADRVYEPRCGDADFLLAAGRRPGDLGARRVDGELPACAELHEDSAREALAELGAPGMTADVTVSDFFDVEKCDLAADAIRPVVAPGDGGLPGRTRYLSKQARPQAGPVHRSLELKEELVAVTHRLARVGRAGFVAIGAVVAVLVALRLGCGVDVVKKAAGIPDDAAGVEKFINGAHALVVPALAMTAAVAPLALISGGLVLLFGGRRGMQIIGTSLGVLLLLGSVTALVE